MGGERERVREEVGGKKRKSMNLHVKGVTMQGWTKKRRSTTLELGECHKTYSLDWKNRFIDTLVYGFLLLTTVLLLWITGVWIYSCAVLLIVLDISNK